MYYGKDKGIFTSSDTTRDDFWDISELIPKKKKTPPAPAPNPSRLAEMAIGREDDRAPRDERARRITFGSVTSDVPPSEEYAPESNRLITRVCIRPSGSGYNFYERFKNDAVRLHARVGVECPAVSFFSYIPQYSQMDGAQLDYYLWFRERARAGESVKCDVSYVFLYIYEIINLSGGVIPAEEGLELLCRVWRLYAKVHPKINKFLSQWLCDYCLIYRLPCPIEQLDDILPVILSQGTFGEFYLGGAMGITHSGVSALVSLLSDYDWRRSRCLGGNEELFERHIYGAMTQALRVILSGGASVGGATATRSIRAFEGSLCAHSFRTVIEVEYRSFTNTPELRRAVTGALKYTENKLRAHISVRSRLSADVDPSAAQAIDAYFARTLSAKKNAAPTPDYERRYSAPDVAPSFSDAEAIERLSWTVTRRLVPEGELEMPEAEALSVEPSVAAPSVAPEPEETLPSVAGTVTCDGIGALERDYLARLLEGDIGGARRILREAHMLEDAVAERINEAADAVLGDIVLLPSDDGYTIVDDYLQEIKEWMNGK